MSLSPTHAANLMRSCRDLVARDLIPARYLAVLDYLLFRARAPGTDRCQVSLSTMARNLHLRRADLVDATRALAQFGLILERQRTRVRVAWQGLMASRNATMIYVFAKLERITRPGTEFPSRTAIREGLKPYHRIDRASTIHCTAPSTTATTRPRPNAKNIASS